ncbi:MAG TPA: DeoR/GlpR family DNA-binding transcription regulator [Verrucomicrobiae bacterium]|nr:DeoR/GlpR family DNA-binding transcription regulator [Verrucomicrobiae bacterium]
MLAVERHQRILEMLLKSGAVSTVEAAKALHISEETARRDFETMEAGGLLSRRHGGAVRLNDNHRDLSLNSRETANVAEKKIIAEFALQQIQTGDTVFFDASSTVFHLARLLPNLEITVLTPALKIAIELARRPAAQVILTGGAVSPRSLSCQGSLADSILERCHVQKAFLSCRGLDAERGLSEANAEQAALKRKIVDLAEQIFLLADHTKIGVKSSYFFGQLSDVDVFITDRKPDNAVNRAIERGGGKLILPKEK